MEIHADFKGAEDSMGYSKHTTYKIKVTNTKDSSIHIDCKGHETVIYSNIIKFLENWTNIQTNGMS